MDHLSDTQLTNYREGSLDSPVDYASIEQHLLACSDCCERYRQPAATLTASLAQELDVLRHPDDAVLTRFARSSEGIASQDAAHIRDCARCQSDVVSLRNYLAQQAVVPTQLPAKTPLPQRQSGLRGFSSPQRRWAAVTMGCVAVSVCFVGILSQSAQRQTSMALRHVTAERDALRKLAQTSQERNNSVLLQHDAERVHLNDSKRLAELTTELQAMRLQLRRTKEETAKKLQEAERNQVAQSLTQSKANLLRMAMLLPEDRMRSGEDQQVEILSPSGTATLDPPLFHWKQRGRIENLTLFLEQNGVRVLEKTMSGAHWTPPKGLLKPEVKCAWWMSYQWEGKQLRTSASTFVILTQAEATRLKKAVKQLGDRRLEQGLLYWQACLFDDSERIFSFLTKDKDASKSDQEIAATMLTYLQNMRQAK